MEYLIRVQDAFYAEGKGFVVVGNNQEWFKNDIPKMSIKGKSVIIETSTGYYTFDVLDLTISFSITEHPFFGIVLKEDDNLSKIANGDKVFKVD